MWCRSFKKSVQFILFCFSLCLFVSRTDAVEVEVKFSPRGGAGEAIINAISNAHSTLDIAMYSFSSGPILEALKRAHDRGVQIRLIFDDAANSQPENEGDTTKFEWSGRYEAAGIAVRYVDVRRGNVKGNMHHKFMIVDGCPKGLDADCDLSKAVLTNGSGNFSSGADKRYDENLLVIKNESWLMTEFQKEFHELWRRSRYFRDQSYVGDMGPYKVEVDLESSPNFKPVFTSQNFAGTKNFNYVYGRHAVADALIRAIRQAKESVFVATGHFRLMALANALRDAKRANPDLDIRVISDSQEYVFKSRQQYAFPQSGPYAFHTSTTRAYDACRKRYPAPQERCEYEGGYHLSRYLFEAGIPIRLKYYAYIWHYPYEPQLHHKYVIVDGREIWTGSYNWSVAAETHTLENVIGFTGEAVRSVVNAYTENFKTLWRLNHEGLKAHQDQLETLDSFPIHFGGQYGLAAGQGAMALTLKEIDNLLDRVTKDSPGFFKEARPEHTHWNVRTQRGEIRE